MKTKNTFKNSIKTILFLVLFTVTQSFASWTDINTGLPTGTKVVKIFTNLSDMYISTTTPNGNYIFKFDSINTKWDSLPKLTINVNAITVFNGNIVIGGTGTPSYIQKLVNNKWVNITGFPTATTTPTTAYTINSLEVYNRNRTGGTSQLYVASGSGLYYYDGVKFILDVVVTTSTYSFYEIKYNKQYNRLYYIYGSSSPVSVFGFIQFGSSTDIGVSGKKIAWTSGYVYLLSTNRSGQSIISKTDYETYVYKTLYNNITYINNIISYKNIIFSYTNGNPTTTPTTPSSFSQFDGTNLVTPTTITTNPNWDYNNFASFGTALYASTTNGITRWTDLTTDVKDVELGSKVSIYPNPSNGQITIEGITGVVSVYDIIGNIVSTVRVNEKNILNLENLPKGMYVIKHGNTSSKIVLQ
jgi:hypothetical protein